MGLNQRGGGWVGRSRWWRISGTWPFATIDVEPEAITLSLLGRPHTVSRSNVQSIRLVGLDWAPPGFSGVRIIHDDPSAPPYLLFWSFNRGRLRRALSDAGYAIGGHI